MSVAAAMLLSLYAYAFIGVGHISHVALSSHSCDLADVRWWDGAGRLHGANKFLQASIIAQDAHMCERRADLLEHCAGRSHARATSGVLAWRLVSARIHMRMPVNIHWMTAGDVAQQH